MILSIALLIYIILGLFDIIQVNAEKVFFTIFGVIFEFVFLDMPLLSIMRVLN